MGRFLGLNRWTLLAVLALLLLLGAGAALNATPARAQAPTTDPNLQNQMEKIASGLYCPVCAGTPLNVCETQACEQWRQLIIQKLATGQNEQQIRQYFIDQYGDRVLGAPPAQGFNLGAYLLPVLILIGGLAIIFFTMRGWAQRRAVTNAAVPATVPPISPEYAQRIAQELKERE